MLVIELNTTDHVLIIVRRMANEIGHMDEISGSNALKDWAKRSWSTPVRLAP